MKAKADVEIEVSLRVVSLTKHKVELELEDGTVWDRYKLGEGDRLTLHLEADLGVNG